MYNKILLAVDGSSNSLRAAERAIEIQKRFFSKVVLFHAINLEINPLLLASPITLFLGGSYPSVYVDRTETRVRLKEKGDKILKSVENIFQKNEVPVEIRLIEDEKPEDYIERIVLEEKFDLVILGCKGEHSKLKRVILGTVPTKVLNDVKSDVMIVR